MRVISQNGCDYPYEGIIISYEYGVVYARILSDIGRSYFLAKYSSDEKAEKAMQKLHQSYMSTTVVENIKLHAVFYFPAEDDV